MNDELNNNELTRADEKGVHSFKFTVGSKPFTIPFALLHHDLLVSIEKLVFIFLAILAVLHLMMSEQRHNRLQEEEIAHLRSYISELRTDSLLQKQELEFALDEADELQFNLKTQSDQIDILCREIEFQSNEIMKLKALTEDGVVPNVLNRARGVSFFNGHRETWYNLNMEYVVEVARERIAGYADAEYWIREDGCKMLGDYIMVAADQTVHPYGSLVETSLGMGIVVDTGSFIFTNSEQIDIAVDWRG